MAFNYEEAYQDAIEIISEFGETHTLTKKGTTGGYDDFGQPIADEPDVVLTGVMSPLLSFKADDIEVSGEKIRIEDKFCFFDANQIAEVGMQTTANGQTWRVQSVDVLASLTGVKVLQKIQLRK